MTRSIPLLIVLVFALGVFIFFATLHGEDSPTEIAFSEFMIQSLTRIIGIFVATIALFSLLFLAIQTAPWQRFSLFLIPFLGGAFLITPNWAIGLSLGLAAIVVPIHEAIRTVKGGQSDS